MVIVSEKDFLDSFSYYQKERAKKYYLARQLYKKISNKSEIGRTISVSNTTVSNWLNGLTKPIAVKQVEKLKSVLLFDKL